MKEAFIKGLESVGHSYEVSDLYADGFNPVMSEKEYIREGFYNLDSLVTEDVLFEQKKINEADAIAFIYPDFWTSSPAMGEWKKEYDDPCVLDGIQWSIVIRYTDGRKKVFEGSNSYPPGFYDFLDIMQIDVIDA